MPGSDVPELADHIERLCECLEQAVFLAREERIPDRCGVTWESAVWEARAAIADAHRWEAATDDDDPPSLPQEGH